jgi:hypothetical protein
VTWGNPPSRRSLACEAIVAKNHAVLGVEIWGANSQPLHES